MTTLTLGDHTFSVEGLHPEALKLMIFIIGVLTDEATEPRARGFDTKHMGIVADTLGMYAAQQRMIQQHPTCAEKLFFSQEQEP
ncbi:MAG: hypothetical protein F6K19_15200 [Cyanothece sp. SIO1E1]|nr:hypothetical protein [Cyanothece sp. SIO1E1]